MIKSILKTISVLLISGICIMSAIVAPGLHNKYLRYEVGESVVKVLRPNGKGGGSGFAIQGSSGKNYIATNAHVCKVSNTGWVKVKSDKGLDVFKRIIYQDLKHDICLVEGDVRLDPLELGSAPKKGELHWIVGHPGLRQLTVSQGEYIGYDSVELMVKVANRESCNGEVVELNPFEQMFSGMEFACIVSFKSYASSAVAYGGNSGSPVVNSLGNVIGILFAGGQQERDSYLVPLPELERVLKLF